MESFFTIDKQFQTEAAIAVRVSGGGSALQHCVAFFLSSGVMDCLVLGYENRILVMRSGALVL